MRDVPCPFHIRIICPRLVRVQRFIPAHVRLNIPILCARRAEMPPSPILRIINRWTSDVVLAQGLQGQSAVGTLQRIECDASVCIYYDFDLRF